MNNEVVSRKEMDRICDNEKEWREYIFKKLEKIEKKQDSLVVTVTTLKIIVGLIGSGAGAISSALITLWTKKHGG